jgi:hypothetical protein
LELRQSSEAIQPTSETVQVNSTEAGTTTAARRTKPKPDTQALLSQLLELRTGLDKTEETASLQRHAPVVDKQKIQSREDENKNLVAELGASREVSALATLATGASRGSTVEAVIDTKELEMVSEMDKRLEALEKRMGVGIDSGSAVSHQKQKIAGCQSQ